MTQQWIHFLWSFNCAVILCKDYQCHMQQVSWKVQTGTLKWMQTGTLGSCAPWRMTLFERMINLGRVHRSQVLSGGEGHTEAVSTQNMAMPATHPNCSSSSKVTKLNLPAIARSSSKNVVSCLLSWDGNSSKASAASSSLVCLLLLIQNYVLVMFL